MSSTIAYILREHPRVVLLENVAAFAKADGGRGVQWLVDTLTKANPYFVSHRTLCTSAHGLPQTRKRWFLIAIRSDLLTRDLAA